MKKKIKNLQEFIDVAGRQRMLSVRSVLDYSMVGVGRTFANPKEDLKNMMIELEDNNERLEEFLRRRKRYRTLKRLKGIEREIRELIYKVSIALGDENRISYKEAMKRNDEAMRIVEDMSKFIRRIARRRGDDISVRVINKAGKMRMFSQEVTALYIMRAWGNHSRVLQKKVAEELREMDKTIKFLMENGRNTPDILEKLKKTQEDILFLSMMNRSQERFAPSLAYQKANNILERMDGVTHRYASLYGQ